MKTIGYTQWHKNTLFYVAQLRGDGKRDGKCDWGYTDKCEKAIHLSPYWARRFAADTRFCGRIAQFIEASV